MESSIGDPLSPESTVTSLLSSSGYLRSSLHPPGHNSTFRYRDQNFDSASAALDAYIADFESSRHNSTLLAGGLSLPHGLPSTLSRARVAPLRNKDVLRERLTDEELDFLNLPVSSLRHRSNRDRLSMTTDELLSIPFDGSMPVTHTSAFIQGLSSQPGASQSCPSSSRQAHRNWDRLGSSHLNQVPHPARTQRRSRCRGGPEAATLKPPVSCYRFAQRPMSSERVEPSLSLHLPHWFTSNKSDMDCSGITGVPDLNYPAWIQRCDLSEPPPLTESERQDYEAVHPLQSPRPGPPSWVAELEDDDIDQKASEVVSQQALADLRLQFAEQISLLAADKKSTDIMETLFRDNRIESLIQKADQVLNSLSQSSAGADSAAGPVSPSDSVEGPDAEELASCLSNCHPLAVDSAAGGVTEALTNRRPQCCSLLGNGVLKQPGPVEALKQMLFRLQAVEAQLQQQQPSVAPVLHIKGQVEEKQRPGADIELEAFLGGPSLQRALHHLNRLKVLVEEPREKPREGEEEKDEGHYSSSSAEGLICRKVKAS
ncbi:uncharacterized protein V6R79_020597 [Siganus canaliculatus]